MTLARALPVVVGIAACAIACPSPGERASVIAEGTVATSAHGTQEQFVVVNNEDSYDLEPGTCAFVGKYDHSGESNIYRRRAYKTHVLCGEGGEKLIWQWAVATGQPDQQRFPGKFYGPKSALLRFPHTGLHLEPECGELTGDFSVPIEVAVLSDHRAPKEGSVAELPYEFQVKSVFPEEGPNRGKCIDLDLNIRIEE